MTAATWLDGGSVTWTVTTTDATSAKPSPIDALRAALEPCVKETPKRPKPITDKALLPIVEQLKAEIDGLRTFAHEAHNASIDTHSLYRQPDGSMEHGHALKYVRDLELRVSANANTATDRIDSLQTTVCILSIGVIVLAIAMIAAVVWR